MPMTSKQQAVIDTLDHCCCAISIPGSGKTTVITHKIAKLLQERPGRRITAVSFTAEAARELQLRTSKLVGRGELARLQAGTFHSLVIRALKGLRHEASRRRVASDGFARNMFRRALSLALGSDMVTEEQMGWMDWCRMTSRGTYGDDDFQETRAQAISLYHQMMREAKLIDFGEIMQIALSLAEEGTMMFGSEGDHLLVDESQDIDDLQLRLILEHFESGMYVDMVGDDDQSIYAFRAGLGLTGMLRFMRHTSATEITLDTNFRCRQEILNWADKIISQNGKNRITKNLIAGRGEGGKLGFYVAETDIDEEEWVAARVGAIQSTKAGTCAIIARTNFLLQQYQAILTQRKIPHKRIGGKSIWEESPVCMFVALLELLQKWKSPAAFEQFMFWMEIRADVIEAIKREFKGRLLQAIDEEQTSEVAENLLDAGQRFKLASQKVKEWRGLLDQGKSDSIVTSVVEAVGSWCFQYARETESDGSPKNKQRKSERLESMSLIPIVSGIICRFRGSIAERLHAVSKLDEKDGADETAVRLVTMHGSKGLEFDHVYIVGCDQGTIPGKNAPANTLEEERRLLYVAMTRAKDYLTITHAMAYRSRYQDDDGPKIRKASTCEFLLGPGMPMSDELPLTVAASAETAGGPVGT